MYRQLSIFVDRLYGNPSDSGSIAPVSNPALLSDDGNWYTVSAIDLGGGTGAIVVDQVAVPPGSHPYLVLQRPEDGLLYKFGLIGTAPTVFFFVDDSPIADAETPTTLTDGFTVWSLDIDIDFNPGLTP